MEEIVIEDLYILTHGTRLTRKGRMLKIKIPTEKKEYVTELVSPISFRNLIIDCQASISTGAIQLLMEHKKTITIQDYSNMYTIIDSRAKMPKLWLKQLLMGENKKVKIAKEIVKGAAENKRIILKKIGKKEAAKIIKKQIYKIHNIKTLETLLGIEGNITHHYFKAIKEWIPEKWGFKGRKQYPPPDPINALLSYGYVTLTNYIEREIIKNGLNPYQGIYHKTYRNRSSLAFDMVEEFRQPIIDALVWEVVAKEELTTTDVSKEGSKWIINQGFKKEYIKKIWTKLEEKEIRGKKAKTMKEIIREQINKLIRTIERDEEYKAYTMGEDD